MIRFSLRELECFIAVAETGSFSLAAVRLHTTQPPVSKSIRSLEQKLGVSLFDRQRGVQLTPAGEAFFMEAKRAYESIQRAQAAIDRPGPPSGRLCIGLTSGLQAAGISSRLSEYRAEQPLDFRVEVLQPTEQLTRLAQGKLDVGFIGHPPIEKQADIEIVSWRDEPLVLMIPSGHALSGSDEITADRLNNETVSICRFDAAPAFTRHVIASIEPHAHVTFRADTSNAVALATTSLANDHLAIVPAGICQQFRANHARLIDPQGAPIRFTQSIAWRRAAGPRASRLVDYLRAA